MSNDSTIPSQLGPVDTMPSQLGPAAGMPRQSRRPPSTPWTTYALVAAVAVLSVYLLGQYIGN